MSVALSISWIGWSTLAWFSLASLIVIYYWIWSRSRFVRLVNALPGPSFFPVLGNFLDLNVDHDGAFSVQRPEENVSFYRVFFFISTLLQSS